MECKVSDESESRLRQQQSPKDLFSGARAPLHLPGPLVGLSAHRSRLM